MNILRANDEHIAELAILFNLYRQFYECEPSVELTEKYIKDRMSNRESVIFVAFENGKLVGFVQS
jgi:hypothetical protein